MFRASRCVTYDPSADYRNQNPARSTPPPPKPTNSAARPWTHLTSPHSAKRNPPSHPTSATHPSRTSKFRVKLLRWWWWEEAAAIVWVSVWFCALVVTEKAAFEDMHVNGFIKKDCALPGILWVNITTTTLVDFVAAAFRGMVVSGCRGSNPNLTSACTATFTCDRTANCAVNARK
jgi:hypothetical protein